MEIIILRGLPGSGKSNYVQKNYSALDTAICSADEYFTYEFINRVYTRDKIYHFQPQFLPEAHKSCFFKYFNCLNNPGGHHYEGNLVVDNTNISAYEVAPYIALANLYSIPYKLVTLICDPAICAARNVHEVPPKIIWQMHQRLLKEEIPPFWNHEVRFQS